jgi:soluble lytic murein transglycosylase-like protein
LRSLILTLIFWSICFTTQAEKLTVPPENIIKIVKQHSYTDFPTALDTLAIIRVESNFKPNAVNPEISELHPEKISKPSNGLMQVQDGPMDIEENITAGTEQLHHYYGLLHKNIEATVKSNNIGIGSYWRNTKKISAADYWTKFQKRRNEYIAYYKKIGDPYHILPPAPKRRKKHH